MRSVPFQQDAIDVVFFQDEFEFGEKCGFDLAGDTGEDFLPRHGTNMPWFTQKSSNN